MKLLWNCSETAPKLLWKCFKICSESASKSALKVLQNLLWNCFKICSKTVLKLLWNYLKTVLKTAMKLLWNCYETALKLLQKQLWNHSGIIGMKHTGQGGKITRKVIFFTDRWRDDGGLHALLLLATRSSICVCIFYACYIRASLVMNSTTTRKRIGPGNVECHVYLTHSCSSIVHWFGYWQSILVFLGKKMIINICFNLS